MLPRFGWSSKALKFFLIITIITMIFFFEVAEGTVDNEPVNTVVVPDKFNNKRYLLMWQHDENIS